MKYFKSATRLFNRDCVNRKGLYLFKEVQWVSVGQRAAELPSIKFGGLKKNSANRPGLVSLVRSWPSSKNFIFTANFDSW